MIAKGITPHPWWVGIESKKLVPCAWWFVRRTNMGPYLQWQS
jgi:hypothetical protein